MMQAMQSVSVSIRDKPAPWTRPIQRFEGGLVSNV